MMREASADTDGDIGEWTGKGPTRWRGWSHRAGGEIAAPRGPV
jgi:hypothetical protein